MRGAPKILIIYAYYETDEARRNLSFFCRHGIAPYRNRQHLVVINGKCSIEEQIPALENVRVIRRDNKGFDFGGWAHALRSVPIEKFDYFFFLNSSVTGPFLPLYQDSFQWTEVFIGLLNARVKLAGITINVFRGDPIVQSMFLATDRVGLELLIRNGIFTGNDNDASKEVVIFTREIESSKIILKAGFHVDCLAMTHNRRALQPLKRNGAGDIFVPGAYEAGHTLEPLDVCFFKTNRGCSPGPLDRSMRLADYKKRVAADRCFQDPHISQILAALKQVPSAWRGYLEFAVWVTCRFLPSVVVDLGVDYGASTYAWGASGFSQVVGIDWFEGDDYTGFRDTHRTALELGDRLAQECGFADTVRIWKSKFEDAANQLALEAAVIHIDGSHAYKHVKKNLKDWLPKLTRGGLLVMHGVKAFPDSVGKLFHDTEGAKTLLTYNTGLGIVSTDAAKIDIIKREWIDKLFPYASGLSHRDFDNLRIQS